MKKLLPVLLLLCSSSAFAQFVNITHTGITDAKGQPLAHGSECFTPVGNAGTPLASNYPGGTATKKTICFTVANGVLQSGVQLLNSSVTKPLNVVFQMTLKDTDTSTMLIGPNDGYHFQPTTDLNLNTIQPDIPSQSVNTPGRPGDPGGPGPTGAAGTLTLTGVNGGFVIPGPLNNVASQSYLNTARPLLSTWLFALHNAPNQAVDIQVFGDSQSRCHHQGNCTVGPTSFGNLWVNDLTAVLQNTYGDHGTGTVPLIYQVGDNSINPDYWTASGSYSVTGGIGPTQTQPSLGFSLVSLSTGSSLTFNTTHKYDRFITSCSISSVAYNLQVFVDGVLEGGASCSQSASSQTATHDVTTPVGLGIHTTQIRCISGPCPIYAGNAVAGTTGVSVSNFSVSAAATNWFGENPASEMAFSDLEPHALSIFMMMTNDTFPGYTVGSFTNNFTAWVNHERALPNPPSLFGIIPPINGGYGGDLAPYTSAYLLLAQPDHLNLPIANVQDRWGTSYVPKYFDASLVHPNDGGSLDIGSMAISALVDTPPKSIAAINCATLGGAYFLQGIDTNGNPVCAVLPGISPPVTYISTTFNEFSNHLLNGTTPAVTTAGAMWQDTGNEFYYLTNEAFSSYNSFATIDGGHADATVRATFDSLNTPAGSQLVFRYIDSNNYEVLNFTSTETEIYDVVGGTSTELNSGAPFAVGSVTVVLQGRNVTASYQGSTISTQIPAGSPTITGTRAGFSHFTAGTVKTGATSFSISSY